MKKKVFRERNNEESISLNIDRYFTFEVDEPKKIKKNESKEEKTKKTTKKKVGK